MNKLNKVYQGDCLEVMKDIEDKSIDMILTDPPYGMSFQSNHRKEQYAEITGDSSLDWLEEFVSQSYRVAKDNTAHYIFCSFHNIDIFKQAFENKFKIKNILVWEKNNTSMGDLKGDFAPKVEFILFIHKGRRLINGKRDPNIFRFSRTGNNLHPTEKPVDMFEYLLSKFSNQEELVLDPFAGSGTTGVACKNLNRNFILIEQDEKHCDIIQSRVGCEIIKDDILELDELAELLVEEGVIDKKVIEKNKLV
jgi:site-specific DNA-methyltransferase (adenine-specific)